MVKIVDLKSKINSLLKQDPNNIEIDSLTKEYRRITQLKKRQHFFNKTQTINELCDRNLNECWKYWKSLNPTSYSCDKICMDDFTQFYSNNNAVTPCFHYQEFHKLD